MASNAASLSRPRPPRIAEEAEAMPLPSAPADTGANRDSVGAFAGGASRAGVTALPPCAASRSSVRILSTSLSFSCSCAPARSTARRRRCTTCVSSWPSSAALASAMEAPSSPRSSAPSAALTSRRRWLSFENSAARPSRPSCRSSSASASTSSGAMASTLACMSAHSCRSFLRSSSTSRRSSSRAPTRRMYASLCTFMASRMAVPPSPRSTRADCSEAFSSASSRSLACSAASVRSRCCRWCTSAADCCWASASHRSSSSTSSRLWSSGPLWPAAPSPPVARKSSALAAQLSARAWRSRADSASCSISTPLRLSASSAARSSASAITSDRACLAASSHLASASL
mmetsp:Transcript_24417/g.72830  ORF Transcript_24417/g.72830 Transcript_24417/m.72830 type:complete len:345 (+) Transcript_24417:31-1065(+)